MQVRTKFFSLHLLACSVAFLISPFLLAAKTLRITAAPSDSSAVIADLQPLFGLPWQLASTPAAVAHVDYASDFIDEERGFLIPSYPDIQPACELWHYEAGRWHLENLAAFSGRTLSTLFALSRRDIWLSFNPERTLKQDLLHFDGRSWRHVPTPNSDRIRTIFMLSPTSGWAGCEWGQIMRYDGRSWHLYPSPTEAHILNLVMTSDSSGFAWTKSHRKQSLPLIYDGQEWRPAQSDSAGLLQLLTAVPAIGWGTSRWPIEILTRFSQLQRPIALRDTLLLEAPLTPNRLLFGHRSGTLLSGHLARSATAAGGGWIARLIEKEEQDSSYIWQTHAFFTLAGDRRSLVIRLPLQRRIPALFVPTYMPRSSWYVAEHGLAIADFNGDGSEDIFAVATGAANHLFLLSPDKGGQVDTETAAAAGLAGRTALSTGIVNYDEGASAADADNDGDQDILVTSIYGHNLLYRQIRRGRFREESDFAGIDNCLARSCSAVWADVNGDGAVDLYISNEDSTNRLYLNNGAGIFRDVTRESGLLISRGGGGSAFGDIDDDGDPDLFVPRYGLANLLFLNEGPPRPGAVPAFRECGREAGVAGGDTLARSTSATWGDVDNDGDLDLFVTNLVHSNQLFLNNGRGRFEEATASRGLTSRDLCQTALLFDADNDGDIDLLTGNRTLNRFYTNKGEGFFYEATEEADINRPANAGGMAALDLGEDGDLDVYLAQGEQRSVLYENRSDNRHWLKLRLLGDRGNRDAIGARLWLYRQGESGGPAQLLGMREINGGSGYNSMSSRIVHFGLPDDGRLFLRVRFPGGGIREIAGISGGRLLEVRESEARARRAGLLQKWLIRLRRNPEFRTPLWMALLLMFFFVMMQLRQQRLNDWPGRTAWLTVALPGLLLFVLLSLLTGYSPWLRFGLGLGMPLLTWSYAWSMFYSINGGKGNTSEELENLYLATSAFFHGEWGARKLNRIEFFCQNLQNSKKPAEDVANAFTQAIDEYFVVIVPELDKIIGLASGGRVPAAVHRALNDANLALVKNLGELKVEIKIGVVRSAAVVQQCSQRLQSELKNLRWHLSSRYICQVDELLVKTLLDYERRQIKVDFDRRTSAMLWARLPAGAFSQILENLLDNAAAAAARSDHPAIALQLDANADYVFLRISDSGPGIPEPVRAKLFHEQISTKKENGGFGLFHAHQTLTKFGGAIRLLPPAGELQGANLEIVLKRIENEQPAATAAD
ncbi:MAG TPA: FG-GAP-like repeat-containing protein [bacterium]|nr:FG-GAP-like repeat-containing protein [bacterium]